MTGLMIDHIVQTAVHDWSNDSSYCTDCCLWLVYWWDHTWCTEWCLWGGEVSVSDLLYHQVIFFIFIWPYFEHRFLFILYQEPSEEGVSRLAQTAPGAASRGTAWEAPLGDEEEGGWPAARLQTVRQRHTEHWLYHVELSRSTPTTTKCGEGLIFSLAYHLKSASNWQLCVMVLGAEQCLFVTACGVSGWKAEVWESVHTTL